MQTTVNLSDADLLARMKNFEDHFVERKTIKDEKDWRKTAVAFANSAPVGFPTVLYIGVKDDGQIETPQPNLDEAQRRLNQQMEHAYPRIPYVPKILIENGLQALAVIIPGSDQRPHFAGPAYVRRGSHTYEASDEQFSELISQRHSKAAMLLQWKGKNVTVFVRTEDSEIPWPNDTVLVDCNQFYATIQKSPTEVAGSFPLSRVEVNFDNLRRRLQLEIADSNRNPWEIELEKHVRAVLYSVMTWNGQQLLRQLLLHGRIECGKQFMQEIPLDVQNREMALAVKHAIVLTKEEESTGPRRIFYVANPDYVRTLRKVLLEALK